jgi:hypothetical protein
VYTSVLIPLKLPAVIIPDTLTLPETLTPVAVNIPSGDISCPFVLATILIPRNFY